MRRALSLLLVLSAFSAEAGAFHKWKKNTLTNRRAQAILTSANCDGASQLVDDGGAITWTRATNATCTKNDATLAILTSGQPRCNSTGCLIEPAATNIGLYSGDMENVAGYAVTATGTGTGQAFPWNATGNVVDPFGGTSKTASRFAWPVMTGGEGADNSSFVGNVYTISGLSGSYTLSVYHRTLSGSQTFYIWGNTGAPSNPVACASTATWARCTATYTAPTAFRIGFDLNTPAAGTQQVGQAAGSLYFWGAQLEVGTLATSYISTTSASVTRNADVPTFNIPSWFNTKVGCLAATVLLPNIPAATYVLLSPSSTTWLGVTSLTAPSAYDGTNTLSASTSSIASRSVTVRTYWSGATRGVVADSGTVVTGSYSGTFVSGTTIGLGNLGGDYQAYGYLSNVKLGSTPNVCD